MLHSKHREVIEKVFYILLHYSTALRTLLLLSLYIYLYTPFNYEKRGNFLFEVLFKFNSMMALT